MEQQGGYDCNFVEDVADYLKCTICQKVLKDPVQIADCGHRFCHSCFHNIKEQAAKRNKELLCPTDKMMIDINKVFDDKGMSRLILDLKVKCNHCLDGCLWSGDLRDLQTHLDCDCDIAEKERTPTLPLDLQKRMAGYEKRLEEKENRLQVCEKLLQEKENRLQICEQKLAEKCEEVASMQVQIDQNKEGINMLKEHEKRLEVQHTSVPVIVPEYMAVLLREEKKQSSEEVQQTSIPVIIPEDITVTLREEKKQSSEEGPSHEDDPMVMKTLSEWSTKHTDREKFDYVNDLCRRKEEQLLIKWLKTRMDLWEFSYQGFTILHCVAIGGCEDVINYLCSTRRIDIDAVNDGGSTPLYFACRNNQLNCARTLIHHGCKVNVKNNKGNTPFDIAQKYQLNEIIDLLQQT